MESAFFLRVECCEDFWLFPRDVTGAAVSGVFRYARNGLIGFGSGDIRKVLIHPRFEGDSGLAHIAGFRVTAACLKVNPLLIHLFWSSFVASA